MAVLGYNVWMNIHDISQPTQVVKDLVEKLGLPNLLNEPTERRAFGRAMRDQNQLGQGRLARQIKESDDSVVYGLVHEDKDKDNEELDYTQRAVVRFNKNDKSVTVQGAEGTQVQATFDHYRQNVTGDDIRAYVVEMVYHLRGISKRPSGGIYFVGVDGEKILRNVKELVAALGFGTVYLERVYDGDEERKNVWENAEQEITGMVKDALERIGKLGKSGKCLQKNVAKVDALKEYMQVYTNLLGEQAKAENLVQVFADAQNTIADKMKELAEAKAKAEQEPDPQPIDEPAKA